MAADPVCVMSFRETKVEICVEQRIGVTISNVNNWPKITRLRLQQGKEKEFRPAQIYLGMA